MFLTKRENLMSRRCWNCCHGNWCRFTSCRPEQKNLISSLINTMSKKSILKIRFKNWNWGIDGNKAEVMWVLIDRVIFSSSYFCSLSKSMSILLFLSIITWTKFCIALFRWSVVTSHPVILQCDVSRIFTNVSYLFSSFSSAWIIMSLD